MAAFKEPLAQEVVDYFFEKGVRDRVHADQFMAYYQTVGWVVGKKKMVSWRGAVSGWILRMAQFTKDVPSTPITFDNSGKTSAQKLEEIEQIKRAYKAQRQL